MVGPGRRSVEHYTKSPFKSAPGPHWVNPSLFTDYEQSLRLVDLDVDPHDDSVVHYSCCSIQDEYKVSNVELFFQLDTIIMQTKSEI